MVAKSPIVLYRNGSSGRPRIARSMFLAAASPSREPCCAVGGVKLALVPIRNRRAITSRPQPTDSWNRKVFIYAKAALLFFEGQGRDNRIRFHTRRPDESR